MRQPSASNPTMRLEETPPNKPKFILVVYMAVAAVVVIILAFILVISWRNRKGHKTPYTRSPTARLAAPAGPLPVHGSPLQYLIEPDAA